MNEIETIVLDILKNLGEEQNNKELKAAGSSTMLFGKNLDSMGIVLLTVEIEERLFDDLSLQITLADERAMSQKTSPFRSTKTLIKYIQLLAEEKKNEPA